MSAEIHVERCILRLVRRTPWPGGPERDALVREALSALPRLLAEELARLFDGAEGVLEAPLRLAFSLDRAELRFVEHGLPAESATAGELPARVFEAVRRAAEPILQGVVRSHPEPGEVAPPADDPLVSIEARTLREAEARQTWHGSVVRALLRYRELGDLAAMLASAPRATLLVWHEVLLHWAPPAASSPAPDPARLEELVAGVRAAHGDSGPVVRVLACVELLLQGLSPGSADARRVLDRLLPLADEDGAAQKPRESSLERAAPGAPESARPANAAASEPTRPLVLLEDEGEAPQSSQPRPAEAVHARRSAAEQVTLLLGDEEVDSVLPFLVLNPLVRMGFVDALQASILAVDPGLDLRLVGAALAFKLLAPPERGWLRSRGAERSARAFAALPSALDGSLLAELARKIERSLSPVAALVANNLAEGHRVGAPLLFVETPGTGGVLSDCDGLFPLACWDACSLSALPRAVGVLLSRELVLIPADAASAERLAALDEAGVRFVTDAPPARGEAWRELGRGGVQRFTNDRTTASRELLAAARPLERATELTLKLWSELDARPSVPNSPHGELDRVLALGAAAGLGSLAWTLWHEREATDPLLAIERLASLSGRVTFEPERVRVRIPLGRRYQDLYRNGFTTDLEQVPWLGGRTLTLSSG